MNIRRIVRHLRTSHRIVRLYFSVASLKRIEGAIQASERRHRGEVRFAVESVLDARRLFGDVQPHERALEVFASLRVWDTAENNGVLIYLLLADRHVEIVADRGIHERVGPEGWDPVCRRMEQSFAAGRFEEGVLQGVQEITGILVAEYPATGPSANELSDATVILG